VRVDTFAGRCSWLRTKMPDVDYLPDQKEILFLPDYAIAFELHISNNKRTPFHAD
jgi:hypothetical protein